MTQVIVVLIGLVVGFAGSRLTRTGRTSSNVRRPGGPEPRPSGLDRLRQLEAEQRSSKPAPPAAPAPPPAPAPPARRPGPVTPPASPPPSRPAGAYVVREGAAPGDSFALSGEAVTVGRGSDRDIKVDDPRASREHGVFRPRRSGPGWSYTDLGSSNGTRINARRITANQRVELRDADVVEIGPARFTFHAAPAPTDDLTTAMEAPDPERTQVIDLDDGGTYP